MFLKRNLFLWDSRIFSYDARVLSMHINPREERDIGGDGGSCVSYYITGVSTLIEDIESGDNTLHGFTTLFFFYVRLGRDHGELV